MDIYKTPKSDLEKGRALTEEEKQIDVLTAVLKQQNIGMGILLGSMGAAASMLALALSIERGSYTLLLVFLMPALVGGLCVRLFGRLVLTSYRLISSVCIAAVIFVLLAYEQISVFAIVISSMSVLVCMAVSRRTLTPDQELALDQYLLGFIRLNKEVDG